MKLATWIVVGAVAVGFASAPAWAGTHGPEAARQSQTKLEDVSTRHDQAIAENVASRLRRYAFYTIYDDVNINVDRGVVTLTGRVTMPYKAGGLAKLAARVDGVREVQNAIETLPVSNFDDQIRVSLANAIYRDPMFANYAIQIDPPIHIIVERGHVTLTGVVNSQVDRIKAEFAARSTFGVFSVENKLRVG